MPKVSQDPVGRRCATREVSGCSCLAPLLAVPLGQSPGQAVQELVKGAMDLWGEVFGEVQGHNQDDGVGQDLQLCKKHTVRWSQQLKT